MSVGYKNYINGKWIDSKSRRTFKSINPANKHEVVGICSLSNKSDVAAAATAAKNAFRKWRLVPAPSRADLLLEAALRLKKEKSRLTKLMVREMGKVPAEAAGDVQEAIDLGIYMAGEGRRLHGETTPSELRNKDIKTIRQPVGVFGLITPWNFPIAIPAWKIFPALVCGNTVVFKPSQYTPCCGAELVKIFDEVGIPPGVLNLILGTGSEAGTAIIEHSYVNAISFTGSTVAGKKIGEFCGKTLKKHSLEMGGKNVIVVDEFADIDLAVDGCLWAGFGTSGQRCTAGSRVIVHQKVYNEFRKKFVAAVKKLKIGPGLTKGTQIGPLINEEQLKKVAGYFDIAAHKDKVSCLVGGHTLSDGIYKKGFYAAPTIYDSVKPHHRVAREEIFGPVVSLMKAKNFDQAIEWANSVDYGLSASIFTKNINNAHTASRDLETGLIYINTSTIGAEIQTPFGGVKSTGNGHREAGGMGGAIDTYSEMKVVSTDYSGHIQKAQGIEWGK